MRALAGNWMSGMISKMLLKKMNRNSAVRNGRNAMPSGPMVCRMMPSTMKSTMASATFWTPVGTSAFLLAAQKKKIER